MAKFIKIEDEWINIESISHFSKNINSYRGSTITIYFNSYNEYLAPIMIEEKYIESFEKAIEPFVLNIK